MLDEWEEEEEVREDGVPGRADEEEVRAFSIMREKGLEVSLEMLAAELWRETSRVDEVVELGAIMLGDDCWAVLKLFLWSLRDCWRDGRR